MTEYKEEEEKTCAVSEPEECPATPVPDMEARVQDLKKQLVDAEDKYLRLYAEFDNFRKRSLQEKADHTKYAARNLIEQILPILDSFEHSRASFGKQNCNLENMQKGFALIHKQFEDALQRVGVCKLVPKGEAFDPRFHEAVMQQDSDQPAHTILEVLQPGYTIHDKLLRPAMVVVAKEKQKE